MYGFPPNSSVAPLKIEHPWIINEIYIFWLKSDISAHSASVDYGAASVIDRLLSAHRIAEYQLK